jgi:nucleotide-binding universal stress UspA family protein
MKLKYKKICVPMDFSPSARNALRMAFQIASLNKATVDLVHIAKPMYKKQYLNVQRKIIAMIERIANSVLQDILQNDQNKINASKLKFNIVVEMGTIDTGIPELIKLKKIDLVILGTNSKNNSFETINTSQLIEILQDMNCSFLTIPVDFNKEKIESVLYPFVNTTKVTDHLTFLNPLLKYEGLWINFFSVNEPPQFVEISETDKQLNHSIDNLKFNTIVIPADIQFSNSYSDKIKCIASDLKVDIIVTYKSFPQSCRILGHSVSNNKMINNSSFPILCLNY